MATPKPKAGGNVALGCVVLPLIVGVIGFGAVAIFARDPNAGKPIPNATPAATVETPGGKRAALGGLAVASLKAALRDPDSLTVDRVLVTDDAKYACIEYRAKNGFGGTNRDHVVFTNAGGDQSARGWNRHCVGRSGFNDVTRVSTMLSDQVGG